MDSTSRLVATISLLFSFVSLHLHNYVCDGYFFGPEFQICDTNRLRKYRKNFCLSKLVFSSNSTKVNSDCVCVSGIWMVINRNCDVSILVSKEGCILTPEIKAMQYLGAFGQEDFFATITQSEMNFTYQVLRPVQNAVVNGFVWVYNGILSRSVDGNYCAERIRSKNGSQKVNEMARFTIHGKLTVQYECHERYTKEMTANLYYDLRSPRKSECKIDCKRKPASKLIIKREMKSPPKSPSTKHPHVPHYLKRVKATEKAEESVVLEVPPNVTTTVTNKTRRDRKTQSLGVKSLIHNLHRRLLTKILSYGFSKDPGIDSRPEFIPQSSFKVLNKLGDIVFKTCAGKVPKSFLEYAYVMFQAAYENRGTNLLEYLTKQDETDIVQFLEECHQSIVPLNFDKNDTFCPDEIKSVEKDGQYILVNFTSNYHKDYYLQDRHLTVEIPWNMIDLTLASCIRAFAESYIDYHKMEQAIEKLITKDLKTLWYYPPDYGTLYTRIYGPHWQLYAENLEKCVQAIYMHNPKLTRLRRPVEIDVNQTNKSELGDFSKFLLGFHMPIPIPEITVGKRQAETPAPKKVPNSILNSVQLTCQPLDKQHCYYE